MRKSVFFICLFLVVLGCTETESVITEEVTIEAHQNVLSARISFLSGYVEILKDGLWQEAEIGTLVDISNSIKVDDDSFCELEFTNLAIVRLEPNTMLNIASYIEDDGASQVAVQLSEGSILCKVKKIVADDSFEVETNSAVCGVRGTEFIVVKIDDDNFEVAVNEGSVILRPVELDLTDIEKSFAEVNPDFVETLSLIESELPLIEAGEELEINEDDFSVLREEAVAMVKEIELIEDDSDIESVLTSFYEVVSSESEGIDIRIEKLSDETIDMIENFKQMEIPDYEVIINEQVSAELQNLAPETSENSEIDTSDNNTVENSLADIETDSSITDENLVEVTEPETSESVTPKAERIREQQSIEIYDDFTFLNSDNFSTYNNSGSIDVIKGMLHMEAHGNSDFPVMALNNNILIDNSSVISFNVKLGMSEMNQNDEGPILIVRLFPDENSRSRIDLAFNQRGIIVQSFDNGKRANSQRWDAGKSYMREDVEHQVTLVIQNNVLTVMEGEYQVISFQFDENLVANGGLQFICNQELFLNSFYLEP